MRPLKRVKALLTKVPGGENLLDWGHAPSSLLFCGEYQLACLELIRPRQNSSTRLKIEPVWTFHGKDNELLSNNSTQKETQNSVQQTLYTDLSLKLLVYLVNWRYFFFNEVIVNWNKDSREHLTSTVARVKVNVTNAILLLITPLIAIYIVLWWHNDNKRRIISVIFNAPCFAVIMPLFTIMSPR